MKVYATSVCAKRMTYKAIEFDLSNRIATITFNRPDRLNAINEEMRDDFSRLFTELQTNEDIGVVIFTGAGRAFSAGGDIEYYGKAKELIFTGEMIKIGRASCRERV